MRDPREPLTTGGYQRPHESWHCGLTDEGPRCPLGPDGGGHCPAAAACWPVRDGDRWHCNRSALRGGPCLDGPGPDGACAIVYQCTPVLSLRVRRGRFVGGVVVAAVGAVCLALGSSWRSELIAPGPLSIHHAQLLKGEKQTLRCAQCHAAGEATLGRWLTNSTGDQPFETMQAKLCLACHEKTVSGESFLAAHSMSLKELAVVGGEAPARSEARRRDPREPLACSACHREHHGPKHDLTAMSNDACQACHRERYDSFAGTHPDFGLWPYERRTRIAFDHAAHQLKHFPAEKRDFLCASCHQVDATGARQLTLDYAATCAACHDKSIAASLTDGLPLVALPMLDVDAMAAAGYDAGPWPEAATGDFEGALSTAAKLLVLADPRGVTALKALGPKLDFFDVHPDDEAQVSAAADGAAAIRVLVNELADRGQVAIAERMHAVLGREISTPELEALSGRLSPDVADAYRNRWFKREVNSVDQAAAARTGQHEKVQAGGWLRDDASLSLRYRPIGHADPWLRAWLDVLAEAASGPHAALAEPMLRAALNPTAPGHCGSCHSIERDRGGRLAIQWRPFDPEKERRGLTHFNHGPHLVAPETGDCTSCHQVATHATSASYAGDDPRQFHADFAPMAKAVCAACHTPHAGGDGCAQCHSYHAAH